MKFENSDSAVCMTLKVVVNPPYIFSIFSSMMDVFTLKGLHLFKSNQRPAKSLIRTLQCDAHHRIYHCRMTLRCIQCDAHRGIYHCSMTLRCIQCDAHHGIYYCSMTLWCIQCNAHRGINPCSMTLRCKQCDAHRGI